MLIKVGDTGGNRLGEWTELEVEGGATHALIDVTLSGNNAPSTGGHSTLLASDKGLGRS